MESSPYARPMSRESSVIPTVDGRERILLSAERLIAEHGAAVPLRDIAVDAGQRNNSAVQYYFGDRDGLIAAVVEYRLAPIERRRLAMLGDLEVEGLANDPARLLDVLARPMFEMSRPRKASTYARFLEQVRAHPSLRAIGLDETRAASLRIVIARLTRAISHLPTSLRTLRLATLTTTLFALLADRERALESGELDAAGDALACDDILRMLGAMLLAPVPATVPALPTRGQATEAASARSRTKRNA